MSVVVGYIHPRPGVHTGNLRWLGRFAPTRGRFPATHPAAPNSPVFGAAGAGQCGDSPMLEALRARGYWVSCFPEGDGITFQVERDQNEATARRDVAECFPGWQVVDERGFTPMFREWERAEAKKDRARRRAYIEGKERARTGKCSAILRYGVFCNQAISHDGPCVNAPPPRPKVCPRCGEFSIDLQAHHCGTEALR